MPKHTGSDHLSDTPLEPSVSRTEPTTTPEDGTSSLPETLKLLADVIRWRRNTLLSFRCQSHRGPLPCQGKTCHRRSPSFGQKPSVKFLERSRSSAGGYRRALKDIFQIVITVFVQAQNGDSLSVPSQLPSHKAVFAAVAVSNPIRHRPQLSLVRKRLRLEQRHQQRGTNRPR